MRYMSRLRGLSRPSPRTFQYPPENPWRARSRLPSSLFRDFRLIVLILVPLLAASFCSSDVLQCPYRGLPPSWCVYGFPDTYLLPGVRRDLFKRCPSPSRTLGQVPF